MPERIFRGCNEFLGLQEAIQSLIDKNNDNAELDLVSLPPKPGPLTDEEEGENDKIQTNDMPCDIIPERVEIVINRSAEDDWDGSDKKPVTLAKIFRYSKEEEEPRWRKC